MRRHRVVVLALDGVIPFELGIPGRVFGIARGADGHRLYEVVTCTPDGDAVRTAADFSVTVAHDRSALATADTVVIPASHEIGPAYFEGYLPDAVAEAFARIRPGTRMVSICTASFILAAAGLLDGRPATTHWMHTEQLRRLYPKVRVNADVLFVDDGDVLTSAGVAAGVDLCLHLVRRDHGTEVANTVARRCVVPPWRDGGQAQYIDHPLPEPTRAGTAAARAWALERLDQPISLRELAARERMSVRTFTRRFREETGMSPGQWLTRQRIDRARHLLEATDLAVDRIARDAGFGTAASMRQHLRTTLGVSPVAYRRTFRAENGAKSHG